MPNRSGYRLHPRFRKCGAPREQQKLGMIERRWPCTVPAGHDAVDTLDHEVRRRGEQFELARGEARRPEIELLLVAVRVADGRDLMQDTGRGVVRLPVLEEPDGERSGKRAERQSATGLHASRDPREHGRFLPTAEQPEPALAQADDGIEVSVVREVPDVHLDEFDGQTFGRGGPAAQADEVRRAVYPDDVETAAREGKRVPSRATADVEHTLTRFERKRADEELDLLFSSLGERVPQVRRPEEPRDGIEPTGCRSRARQPWMTLWTGITIASGGSMPTSARIGSSVAPNLSNASCDSHVS